MDRCEEARRFQRIDDAFQSGDLEALRAAVDDPAVIPNGQMPDVIGPCLVYAIYHSPLAFIRTGGRWLSAADRGAQLHA
jgi:hypothetical protein